MSLRLGRSSGGGGEQARECESCERGHAGREERRERCGTARQHTQPFGDWTDRRAGLILSNRSGANCVNLGSAGQRRWAAGAPTGAALAAAAYPFAVAFAARFAPLRPHRRVRSWTRVLAWVARSRGAPTPRARSSVKNKAKRSRSSRSWRSCCWTRSLSTAAALRLVGRSHQAPWGAVSPPLPP